LRHCRQSTDNAIRGTLPLGKTPRESHMKYLVPAFCAAVLMGYGLTTPAHSIEAKGQHSAKSIECSKMADQKGLHGKARKHFRSKCKHGKM
jgi:hypothetical protein